MGVPRKIREQAEAADAAVAELTRLENQPLTVDPVTGQPATPDVPAAPTPPVEDFAQKYRTLQGKYDSEVPLLRSQLQNYERMNTQLASQLAALSDQIRILEAQPPAHAPAGATGVTDADVAQYGPELIDLMRRIAADTSSSVGQNLKDTIAREVGAVRADVSHVQADQKITARQRYEEGLSAAVTNWREINATQEWLAWLGEFDPILGSTRQAAVTAAYNAYDVPRTVAFLQRYLALQQPSTALTPQEELARQVSPRGSVAPGPVPSTAEQPQGRIWTQQQIAEAYTAQIQGRNRLPQAQWEALEAEITLAVAEGRVR